MYLDQDQVLKRHKRLYSNIAYTKKSYVRESEKIGERKGINERGMDRDDQIQTYG